MKTLIFFSSLFLIALGACKKSTDIEVKLYNPYLDEYVSGATIAIIERKGDSGGGVFSGSASCREIATDVTDENGVAVFNNTKLKTRKGYVYFPVLKEAWGLTNDYPCGGYNGKLIDKGGNNSFVKSDRTNDGIVKIQYNNLFNPAAMGDSIYATADRLYGYDPELGQDVGGGGLYSGIIEAYNVSQAPYPNILIGQDTKINGRFKIHVRKRKMGMVTDTSYIVKAYPNQTTIIQVNW